MKVLKECYLALLYFIVLINEVCCQNCQDLNQCQPELEIKFLTKGKWNSNYFQPGLTERLVVRCSIDAKKNNLAEIIYVKLFDRHRLHENVEYKEAYLRKSYPKEEDEGIYECTVKALGKDGFQKHCSEFGISVAINGDSSCSAKMDLVAITDGKLSVDYFQPGLTNRLVLYCSISARKWVKNDSLVLYHNKKKIYETTKTYVTIVLNDPGRDKQGLYECKAVGPAGHKGCSAFGVISAMNLEICPAKMDLLAITDSKWSMDYFQPGLTKRLIVHCSMNATSTEWESVDFLMLRHHKTQVDNIKRGISTTGESYLTKAWSDPGEDKEGIYECIVSRTLKSGQKKQCSVFGVIYAKNERCVTKVTAETLAVQPNPNNYNITKKIVVNCSIDVSERKNSGTVQSLSLYYAHKQYIPGRLLAEVDTDYRENGLYNTSGHGAISTDKKKGHMSLELPYLDLNNEGIYTCNSVVKEASGKTEKCKAKGELKTMYHSSCAESFKLSAQPHNRVTNSIEYIIRPGITDYITFNCTLDASFILHNYETLLAINLLHSEKINDNFEVVAWVNSSSDIDLQKGLSNTGVSYLYHTLTYPDMQHAGTYKCEAVKVFKEEYEHTCSVSTKLFTVEKKKCSSSIYAKSQPHAELYVRPGSTEKLVINCSFNFQNVPAMSLLESLTLLRSYPGEPAFHEVASIRKNNQLMINDSEAVGDGSFTAKHKSYIYLEWIYPSYGARGEYRCVAKGFSYLKGQNETCISYVKVNLQHMSLKSVSEEIRLNLRENVQLLDENQKLNVTLTRLKGLIEKMKDEKKKQKASIAAAVLTEELKSTLENLFFISNPYNGRRYYLAKSASLVYPELAQDTCAQYKGYLAEIDDQNEFNFVNEFLKTSNGKRYFNVLISGRDEIENGSFLYARNNTRVKYFSWGKDQPDGGDIENCLYLQADSTDWNFFDKECVRKSAHDKFSYLCEIEETK